MTNLLERRQFHEESVRQAMLGPLLANAGRWSTLGDRRMAIASDFVIQNAAAEIQYERGIVYLDKCGSLMLSLQDALGTPKFEGSVPQMNAAELKNEAERFVIQYGPNSVTAAQAYVPSIARFEQVAPVAWQTVSGALGVGKQVLRCGVRFMLLWKADSYEESTNGVSRCALLRPSDGWLAALGDAPLTAAVGVVRDKHGGQIRIGLDVNTTRAPSELPPTLAKMVPKYAVLLDMDHSFPGSTPPLEPPGKAFAVTPAQFKDFIRSSWERTRTVAATVTRLLAG